MTASVFNSDGGAIHISWSKCCLSVCRGVKLVAQIVRDAHRHL